MCVTEACALLAGCHDRENCFFSASPPIQGELETVDMIEKRFPQHLKKLFSVRFSHWLDSLLDDQPDWLQVIDSCLCNRLTQYRLTIKARRGGGGGGKRALDKIVYGKATPRGPTPYPFIYHFWQKRYPFRQETMTIVSCFRIPSIDQIVPLSHLVRTLHLF